TTHLILSTATSKNANSGSPASLTIDNSGVSTVVASALTVDATEGFNVFDFSQTQQSLAPTDPLSAEGHFHVARASHGINLDLTDVGTPQTVSYTVVTDANGSQQLLPNVVTLMPGSTVSQVVDSPFADNITTAVAGGTGNPATDPLALPEAGTTVQLT